MQWVQYGPNQQIHFMQIDTTKTKIKLNNNHYSVKKCMNGS